MQTGARLRSCRRLPAGFRSPSRAIRSPPVSARGRYFLIPRDINFSTPLPDQRPYAGWLHGSGLLIRTNEVRQDTWKIDLGVVGPSALAEPLEEFFRRVFNGRDMRGWDNQITDRAVINASFERRWRKLIPIGDHAWQEPDGDQPWPGAGERRGAADTGVDGRIQALPPAG